MALVGPPIREPNQSSYLWLDWFQKLHDYITAVGALSWTVIDFASSNITDIVTRNHVDLQNKQGGTTNEYYHLTSSEYTGTGSGAFARTTSPLFITPKTTGYTVATLPAGTVGMRAHVTNALGPAYLVAVVGGGAVTCPVFYNGAAWVVG